MLDGPQSTFRIPGYVPLWLSGAGNAFTWSLTGVAIGWMALQLTGSSLAVGLTFAARLAPALLFGIPIGVLIDRVDRRRILVATNLGTAAACLLAAAAPTAGPGAVAALVLASLALGTLDTARGTASQAYAVDLSGAAGATHALAWINLATAVVASVGALVGGVILDRIGAPPVFVVAGASAAAAALVILVAGRRSGRARRTASSAPSLRSSFTLLARERVVRHIVVVVIAGEVLGFATMTLFPGLARDVLHTDAAGFGALSAARSVGGFLGLLLLTRSGLRQRGGWFLLTTASLLGASLVALALSGQLLIALAVLLVVGGAMAVLDTIGQTLVQQRVPDHERGAAVGIWYFAIGFGPVGHLGLGAIASGIGVAPTLALSGIALATVAAVAAWRGPLARVA
jgi:MFS family permease